MRNQITEKKTKASEELEKQARTPEKGLKSFIYYQLETACFVCRYDCTSEKCPEMSF